METTELTLEIKQANNPGFTDFGSGNIIALTSQCLRCTKTPTPCTICSDFCPVDAIETTLEGRPRFNSNCINCAACIGVCPTNAIAGSTRTIQQFMRLALLSTLRVDHLVICCERTSGLLRLESHTDKPEAALAALRLIEESQAGSNLCKVPCLAMLTKELWFALLNEIGTLKYKELSVFLPLGQCEECPVNVRGNVEDLFGEAIDTAEKWSGYSVGIITQAESLPQTKKANIRAYLTSDAEMDRRGAFSGFIDELKHSWEDNAEVGNKALDEVEYQRLRRKSFERTRMSADLKKPRQTHRSPIATTTRYAFTEALGRRSDHAEDIRLLVSATDDEQCDQCATCVSVCPVKARYFKAEDAPDAEVKEPSNLAHSLIVGGAQISGGDNREQYNAFSGGSGEVAVNELYCVACSACLQACPQAACYFTEIDGTVYLSDEPEDEPDSETEDEAEGSTQ